jgi:hypothetical protein
MFGDQRGSVADPLIAGMLLGANYSDSTLLLLLMPYWLAG